METNPVKILIVDDEHQLERLISQRLRHKIRAKEYDLYFCLDGIEALKFLENNAKIDIVLTDINMPRMDGLELLGELTQKYPSLKTIIVSAYGDMSNIRKAMNLGAFDFITKPIDFADLEKTIAKTIMEIEQYQKYENVQKLEAENETLMEVDRLKSHFFTNISHEFRTPLTIINGMVEQINEQPDEWLNKGVATIKKNSRQLLTMVNQILELRKIQSKELNLQLVQLDVVGLIKTHVQSYLPLMEMKDLKFVFNSSPEKIMMDVDSKMIKTILSNLLSNAIKYTDTGGIVSVNISKQNSTLHIEINDTGIGIPEDLLDNIFDRFFQIERENDSYGLGTGIGLSLTRELVHLLKGRISVTSKVDEGTAFKIQIPITNQAKLSSENQIGHTIYVNTDEKRYYPIDEIIELPQVLIIEDHKDVADYIQQCLSGLYQTQYARNGLEGIEQAIESIPDLIISDVMMPLKDGLEVCSTLKQDQRTSHIPIILLTAKADIASKLEGLERGADAYLAKPFDKRELIIRLEKLLELRKVLRDRYRSEILDENPAMSREDRFVEKIKEIVHQHMEDEEFGILQLCKEIGMSRTQLHRKIKAITGVSTSIFIRQIRLLKAKGYLLNSDMSISQIAYQVGFNDPKYFSTSFSNEFGQSPKDFRISNQGVSKD